MLGLLSRLFRRMPSTEIDRRDVELRRAVTAKLDECDRRLREYENDMIAAQKRRARL